MTALTPSQIPPSWDDVTAEWLADAVAARHPGAVVGKVTLVDQTKGNNRRARFRLEYAAGSGPEFLFAKAEGDFREMHAKNGNLFNEPALFASGVDIPVDHPLPYKVVMDAEANDYVVFMEDITARGAEPLTVESTMSVAQALDGVRGLARLHALYWDRLGEVPALSWLRAWLDALELPACQRPGEEEVRTRYSASMAFALPIWFATFNASVTQSAEGSLELCRRYGQAFVDLDTPGAVARLVGGG